MGHVFKDQAHQQAWNHALF